MILYILFISTDIFCLALVLVPCFGMQYFKSILVCTYLAEEEC